MRFDRTVHTTQLLQLLMWAGVVLPASLFIYASLVNYRALDQAATERVERNLDVLQEHALKVFQTIDRAIARRTKFCGACRTSRSAPTRRACRQGSGKFNRPCRISKPFGLSTGMGGRFSRAPFCPCRKP